MSVSRYFLHREYIKNSILVHVDSLTEERELASYSFPINTDAAVAYVKAFRNFAARENIAERNAIFQFGGYYEDCNILVRTLKNKERK